MNEKKKEPFFHVVKRDALPWYQSVGIRAVAIILALIVCGISLFFPVHSVLREKHGSLCKICPCCC